MLADNIILKSPRQSAEDANMKIGKTISNDDEDNTHQPIDVEWEQPYRLRRKIVKKPEDVVLTLPSREIPSILASTSTMTKTSSRHELNLVSTLLKAGGEDIDSTTMSISSIRRHRKSAVEKKRQ